MLSAEQASQFNLLVGGLQFLNLFGVTKRVALGKGVNHLLVLLDDEGDFGSGHLFEVLRVSP